MFKFCSGCNTSKKLSDFYPKGNNLTSRCKSCFRKYYDENKSKRLDYAKSYIAKNKEKVDTYRKQYRQSHRDQERIYYRKYKKDRYHKDLDFRIRCILRSRIRDALQFGRAGSSVEGLDCSIKELKQHLENQFQPGMSWENYGEWHIDHIIPLASFDLSDKKQFRKACHYTNLQPLWKKDNLTKRDSVEVSS